jgi:hypothetical protein
VAVPNSAQTPAAAPIHVADAGHFLLRAPSFGAEVRISVDAIAIASPSKFHDDAPATDLPNVVLCQSELRKSQGVDVAEVQPRQSCQGEDVREDQPLSVLGKGGGEGQEGSSGQAEVQGEEGIPISSQGEDGLEGGSLDSAVAQTGQPSVEVASGLTADPLGEEGPRARGCDSDAILGMQGHAEGPRCSTTAEAPCGTDSCEAPVVHPDSTPPSSQMANSIVQDSGLLAGDTLPEALTAPWISSEGEVNKYRSDGLRQADALERKEQEVETRVAAPAGDIVAPGLERFPSLPATSVLFEAGDFSSMNFTELHNAASMTDVLSGRSLEPGNTGPLLSDPESGANEDAFTSQDHHNRERLGTDCLLGMGAEAHPLAGGYAHTPKPGAIIPSLESDPLTKEDGAALASTILEEYADHQHPSPPSGPVGLDGTPARESTQGVPERTHWTSHRDPSGPVGLDGTPGLGSMQHLPEGPHSPSQWSPSPPGLSTVPTLLEPGHCKPGEFAAQTNGTPQCSTPGALERRDVEEQETHESPMTSPCIEAQPSPRGPIAGTSFVDAHGDHVPSRGCFQSCSPRKMSPTPQRSLLATLRQAFTARQSPGVSPLRATLPVLSCRTPGLAVLTTPPSPCPAYAVRRTSSISFPSPMPDEDVNNSCGTPSADIAAGLNPSHSRLPNGASERSARLDPGPDLLHLVEPAAPSERVTALPGETSPTDSALCVTEGRYSPSWEEEASEGSEGGRIVLGPHWDSWRCGPAGDGNSALDGPSRCGAAEGKSFTLDNRWRCGAAEEGGFTLDGRPVTAPLLGSLDQGNAADGALPRNGGTRGGTALQRLAERRRRQQQSALSSVRSSLQSGR